jgi:hypothetical protein
MSGPELAIDERDESADGLERGPVDLIVVDREPEPFLERCQYACDRHGIEFRKAAEQRGFVTKIACTTLQTQHVVQHSEHICADIQTHSQIKLMRGGSHRR